MSSCSFFVITNGQNTIIPVASLTNWIKSSKLEISMHDSASFGRRSHDSPSIDENDGLVDGYSDSRCMEELNEGGGVGSSESTRVLLKERHFCPNRINIPSQSFPLAIFPPPSIKSVKSVVT